VLWNLLKNAVKFTADGGWIHVTTDSTSKPGSILIEVSDNGMGMSSDELSRVFDAFMQGERDAAQFRTSDTGLLAKLLPPRRHPDGGLLIRKRIYDAMSGHPAGENAEAALLRRLGRIALLAASARRPIT